MKFKYILGIRPIPRIAMFDNMNSEAFIQISNEMLENLKIDNFQQLQTQYMHVWNPGAYIVYDDKTLMIMNMVFNDFPNLIFLLRYINKELWCNLENCMTEIFKIEITHFVNEFLLY